MAATHGFVSQKISRPCRSLALPTCWAPMNSVLLKLCSQTTGSPSDMLGTDAADFSIHPGCSLEQGN